MRRNFFKKLDSWLSKAELKGQNFANSAHKWAINIVLLTMLYNIYGIFSGYNDTMLTMRQQEEDVQAIDQDYEQAARETQARGRGFGGPGFGGNPASRGGPPRA